MLAGTMGWLKGERVSRGPGWDRPLATLGRWKLSCSKGAGPSRQWRGVSGLLSLVLCSLWVYSVNSCPSLFQMVTRTKKIFVGGLSVNTTVEDVKQYFEQFGKVSPLKAVASGARRSFLNCCGGGIRSLRVFAWG